MSKVLLTIEQVRFIWSLGFMSGRVQESSHPKQGVAWEEETPIFVADLSRLSSVNKQLSKKLQAANKVLHSDVAICEDCKKNPALEGCSVCAGCGL